MARNYIHALRFRWLNRFYDPAVRLLTRERYCKNLLLREIDVEPGEALLDLGCGSGTLALMVKAANDGTEVHGLDGDSDMLRRARAKAIHAGTEVRFHLADATELPFPDHRFDQVVSSLFFHHLDHETKAVVFSEIIRVLRPGGRLLIADWGPAADPLQWLLCWPVRWLDGPAVTRDNFAGRLPGMLKGAGFGAPANLRAIRTPVGTLRFLQAAVPG